MPLLLWRFGKRWHAQDVAAGTRYDVRPGHKASVLIKGSILGLIYAGALLLYLFSWTIVGPSGIEQRMPWSHKEHSFDQIASLEMIPDGMRSDELVKNGPWFNVVFTDGRSFAFGHDNEGCAVTDMSAIATYIAEQWEPARAGRCQAALIALPAAAFVYPLSSTNSWHSLVEFRACRYKIKTGESRTTNATAGTAPCLFAAYTRAARIKKRPAKAGTTNDGANDPEIAGVLYYEYTAHDAQGAGEQRNEGSRSILPRWTVVAANCRQALRFCDGPKAQFSNSWQEWPTRKAAPRRKRKQERPYRPSYAWCARRCPTEPVPLQGATIADGPARLGSN